MKVDLAAQTFSASSSSAIEYLMKRGLPEFAGADGLIEFSRMFDHLFDVFNTKNNQNVNVFKNAINTENAAQIFALFDRATEYIKGLQVLTEKGRLVLVCSSKIYTGFNGFIINMMSLKLMFQEMVEEEQILENIRTYYIKQDPVEILFGKIRSFGRNNCNPTCEQFGGAFRKFLAYNTIMYSKFWNCNLDDSSSNPFSNILSITSRRTAKTFDIAD